MRRVFLANANTLSGLVRTENGGYSVLQRSDTATRAFTVDCHVKLIDASLEEGVVTSS